MKTLGNLLEEFQHVIETKTLVRPDANYYAAMSLIKLREACLEVHKLDSLPKDRAIKRLIAKMHMSLRYLAKMAVSSGLSLSSFEPYWHDAGLDGLLSKMWFKEEYKPFCEHMLFSIQTHMFFVEGWSLNKLLEASIRMLSRGLD